MTDPIKLLAHRRYYLVVKMGGVACWVGEGGSYLHCLQTERGGVQVVFETPDSEELGRWKLKMPHFSSVFIILSI